MDITVIITHETFIFIPLNENKSCTCCIYRQILSILYESFLEKKTRIVEKSYSYLQILCKICENFYLIFTLIQKLYGKTVFISDDLFLYFYAGGIFNGCRMGRCWCGWRISWNQNVLEWICCLQGTCKVHWEQVSLYWRIHLCKLTLVLYKSLKKKWKYQWDMVYISHWTLTSNI